MSHHIQPLQMDVVCPRDDTIGDFGDPVTASDGADFEVLSGRMDTTLQDAYNSGATAVRLVLRIEPIYGSPQ